LVEFGVDHRGVQGEVPQHVGHIFDGTTAIDNPTRQGVAQGMAATVRNTGATQRPTDECAYSVNPDGLIVRRF
jgi:hypothetical protein